MSMRNIIKSIGLTVLAVMMLLSLSFSAVGKSAPATSDLIPAPIENFQLVDEDQGYVQIGRQLFWTNNNGADWTEITPQAGGGIIGLYFLDTQTGFLVTQELTYTQELSYALLSTQDQGQSWSEEEIFTLPIRDPQAGVSKASVNFIDQQTGWIVFKQASSSNFNLGQIYHTKDGGQSWEILPAPIGEMAAFTNSQLGFIAGGVYEQNLYQSIDGGMSWAQPFLTDDFVSSLGQPNFLGASLSFLPALVSTESGTELQVFSSTDSGSTWEISQSTPVSGQTDRVGFFSNIPGEIKILVGDSLYTYYLTSGQITSISPLSLANITAIEFVSYESGWAISNQSDCKEEGQPCSSETKLYSTGDTGLSWQPISTPEIFVSQPQAYAADFVEGEKIPLLSRTSVLEGQGFDQCEISSLSNLQAWKNDGPLTAVNLYIGGATRACPNTRIANPTVGIPFIESLSIQGWKFIPTWVGPQASCTNFSVTMSPIASTAYGQGRGNATDALRYARKLGLAEADDSGTVIYYDLEAFNTDDTACLNAAKAFINGWVERLHESGVTAGVYGSVLSSGFDSFYTIDNPPDVIWPAYWRYAITTYNSGVTPYGLPLISDSMWSNQQRIYQYTGAHAETWGGVTMNIDLNSIDGIVADISRQVGVPDSTLQNHSFESGVITPWEINETNPSDCDWQIVNDPAIAHSDDHFLAINRTSADCSGFEQELTETLTYGDRYRFAIWARSGSSSDPRALTLKMTGAGVAPQVTTKYFSNITDEWSCLETDMQVNSGSLTGITPEIELENSDGINLNLDNAHLSLNTDSLCPTIPSPTGMYATPYGERRSVLLSWDEVPSATVYQVYRSVAPDTTKTFLSNSSTNQFVDTDASYWDMFNYWVRACTAGKCSQFSQLATSNAVSPATDFYDGFETGNVSRWTSVSEPSLIEACDDGALNGRYGLCVDADTTNGGLLGLNLTNSVDDLTIDFKLDPNDFNPGTDNNPFAILKLYDTDDNKLVFHLRLIKNSGNYKIRAYILDNNGTTYTSTWTTINNESNHISITWKSTKADGRAIWAGSAGYTLEINGAEIAQLTGIDNTLYNVDKIYFGGQNIGGSSSSSGIFYLDEFNFGGPLHIRQ